MSLYPGFIGPAYVSRSPNVARETLRNWMPQTTGVGAEPAHLSYMNRPGLSLYCVLDDAPVRGLFSQDGATYAVGGGHIYQITSGNVTVTNLGPLTAKDSHPVVMQSNGVAGNQLFVPSGGSANVVNLTTGTISPVTGAGFPGSAPMAAYSDGYFIVSKNGTQQFNISASLNGLSWSALDFDLVTQASNNLVGMIQTGKIVWAVGSRSAVPFYDAGVSPFPFAAVPQVLVETGTIAPFSLCKTDTLAGWLHQSERGAGQFIVIGGGEYSARRASTYAVESRWAKYPTIADCVAFTMTWHGHEWAVLHFVSGNESWAYDFTESAQQQVPIWSQWSWWNTTTGNHDRFRGWVHCESPDGHLVGDWETGAIYMMDDTLATDNGNPIVWERCGPHLNNQRLMAFYSEFMVDQETGLGGSTPTATLDWSDDGGHTFGVSMPMSTGAIGQYQTRCRVAGSLGQSRDRMYRYRVSNSVPPRPFAAYLNVAQGTN